MNYKLKKESIVYGATDNSSVIIKSCYIKNNVMYYHLEVIELEDTYTFDVFSFILHDMMKKDKFSLTKYELV